MGLWSYLICKIIIATDGNHCPRSILKQKSTILINVFWSSYWTHIFSKETMYIQAFQAQNLRKFLSLVNCAYGHIKRLYVFLHLSQQAQN